MIKYFNGTTSALDTVMKPTNTYKHLRVSYIILQYASYMLWPVLWHITYYKSFRTIRMVQNLL